MKSKFHKLLIGPLKTRKKADFLVCHCASFISLTSKFGWLEVLNFLILEVSGSPGLAILKIDVTPLLLKKFLGIQWQKKLF